MVVGLLACEARPAAPGRSAAVVGIDQVEHRRKGEAADVYLLARGDNAFIGRLEMAPGGEVPEHRDPTEEYIHILEGGGTFSIDDRTYSVGPGSTIYMPANAKVSFKNGETKLVAIQVFAGPGPASKYEAWTPVTPTPAASAAACMAGATMTQAAAVEAAPSLKALTHSQAASASAIWLLRTPGNGTAPPGPIARPRSAPRRAKATA